MSSAESKPASEDQTPSAVLTRRRNAPAAHNTLHRVGIGWALAGAIGMTVGTAFAVKNPLDLSTSLTALVAIAVGWSALLLFAPWRQMVTLSVQRTVVVDLTDQLRRAQSGQRTRKIADIILDRNDVLYAGSRHGDIMRFFPPDYERMEVFAHIGGQPLGMAFDRKDNLYVCIGGMGLYRITPDGTVEKANDDTNRSLHSVNDDSRLRLADDLDITDDGLIFFSEATVRYEMDEWPIDGLEARGIDYTHRLVPGAPLQQLFLADPNNIKIEINFPI